MLIEFQNVTFKTSVPILDSVSFQIKEGETVGILTRSGYGMSSILKLADGLLLPNSGKVLLRGYDTVATSKYILMKQKAKNGFYFQDNALIYSMNIYDNLAFYFRINTKLKEKEIYAIIKEALHKHGVSDIENSNPANIPMSQNAIINFIRSTLHKPDMIFIDGFYYVTDPIIRKKLSNLIEEYIIEYKPTALMNGTSVSRLSNYVKRIIIINKAKIYFDGTSEEYYNRLRNEDEVLKEFI